MNTSKKTATDKIEVKTISKTSGIPMSEESYKEWEKAFIDIEDCINDLYKGDKK